MKRLAIGCVVVIGIVCLTYAIVDITRRRSLAMLDHARQYIETTYAAEIDLIEKRVKEVPNSEEPFKECFWTTNAIKTELGEALTKPEVFWASWSSGSGTEGLTPLNEGFLTFMGSIRSNDESGLHTLYFGRSSLGRGLFVYEGRVPHAVKKRYTIVFYRAPILDGIDNEGRDARGEE